MSASSLRLLCTTAAAAAALALGAAAHASGPVIYGYPYTARCPGAGIADVVDRFDMYACNCTSYVAWALWVNHQRVDWFIPGAMNAWNWPHVARLSHLRVDRRPAVGTVAVWPNVGKPFGHVAYVIGVHAHRMIDVAEYNSPFFSGRQTFVFDMRYAVSSAGAVFIHVPRRTPDEPPR